MLFIKNVFLVLYFISNVSIGNCLQCANCDDILLSFNQASELPTKCEGKIIEGTMCRAIFHIDYLTKDIRLQLIKGDDSNRTSEINLIVEDKFAEPKRVACNITYNCKDSNDCAKVFYQKNIQILIEKESVLNQIRNELYDPMINNIQQCVDHNDQSMACVNAYGCHGYEIIENNKSQYHGECRNASSMTARQYLYSEITLVQGYPTSASDWNHLGYTCNKRNLCNTNEQIKQMVKIANNFYPWEFIGVNSSVNLTISNYYIVLLLFLFYFTY